MVQPSLFAFPSWDEDLVTIYTDGGCSGNPGPGAWAYVLLSDHERISRTGCASHTTNNRMELSAVIAALKKVQENAEWSIRPIDIFTDSQYVQRGVTEWMQKWIRRGWRSTSNQPVKNQDLWMELNALGAGKQIRWKWVRGHTGNAWNEECDRLVRVILSEQKRKNIL